MRSEASLKPFLLPFGLSPRVSASSRVTELLARAMRAAAAGRLLCSSRWLEERWRGGEAALSRWLDADGDKADGRRVVRIQSCEGNPKLKSPFLHLKEAKALSASNNQLTRINLPPPAAAVLLRPRFRLQGEVWGRRGRACPGEVQASHAEDPHGRVGQRDGERLGGLRSELAREQRADVPELPYRRVGPDGGSPGGGGGGGREEVSAFGCFVSALAAAAVEAVAAGLDILPLVLLLLAVASPPPSSARVLVRWPLRGPRVRA